MSVFEDIVELPSGQTIKYVHLGEAPDIVTVIPVKEDGNILIEKEYSYPPNEWLYQFPGGGVKQGESPSAAASRELTEETNLAGTLFSIGWFYDDNRRKKSRNHVFVAKELRPKKGLKDAEEEMFLYWHTESEVNALIRSGEIVNYSLLAAWSLFNAYHKK